MTARLEVTGATVRFGATEALAGVDLAVAAGELVVVLGPSGSGKSTLLRSIAGLQALDGGRIAVDGVDQRGVPPHRRGVGLMFQDHALFPHLDVGANVAFGLRMQHRPRAAIADRVQELLTWVGLPGAALRAVHTLSGGEQQRVALARALAPSPRLLLLDEPLGALDRPLRDRLVGELGVLFRRLGTTVVAVTHDQSEAFALGDRLAIMDRGAVLQSGPPADLWARPASRVVAAILGFPNVVEARVEHGRLLTPWGDLGAAEGQVVAAAVRPELVRVDSAGPLAGTVAETTFGGAHSRVRARIDGAPDLRFEVTGSAAPPPGTDVRLSIPPGAVIALAS